MRSEFEGAQDLKRVVLVKIDTLDGKAYRVSCMMTTKKVRQVTFLKWSLMVMGLFKELVPAR